MWHWDGFFLRSLHFFLVSIIPYTYHLRVFLPRTDGRSLWALQNAMFYCRRCSVAEPGGRLPMDQINTCSALGINKRGKVKWLWSSAWILWYCVLTHVWNTASARTFVRSGTNHRTVFPKRSITYETNFLRRGRGGGESALSLDRCRWYCLSTFRHLISSPIAAGSSSCLTYTVAVYAVLSSWWWTERPFETCRAFYMNK